MSGSNVTTPAAIDNNGNSLIYFDPISGTCYIGAAPAVVLTMTSNFTRLGTWKVAIVNANATDVSSITLDNLGLSIKTNNDGNAVRIADANGNLTGQSLNSLSTLSVNAGQFAVDNAGNATCASITATAFANIGGAVQGVSFMCIAAAVLDFPSTASGAVSVLTIACTGAAVGDCVSLGIPNASIGAGACGFYAWVSASGTVSVRFWNASGVAVDPASGTFRVMVTR